MKTVRTTVRLDPNLMREVKKLAAQSGRTFTAVLEDALREVVARRDRPAEEKPFKLPTFTPAPGKEGVWPGVNITKWTEILDLDLEDGKFR